MEFAGKLLTRFGRFILLVILIFLGLLVSIKRFGFAAEFANYFLLLLLLVFPFLIFYSKNKLLRSKLRSIPKTEKFVFRFAQNKSVSEDNYTFSKKFLFLGWIGILLPAFLVFKSIFYPGPVVWGDAPFFYPEAFANFSLEPLVWEARGRLGVVNDLYWIYPLMLIYKVLGALGFSNDLIIRILFYFPALVSALLSPWLLTRRLGFSQLVSFFSTLVYGLSTYFILVVDGGQIGVALAYGLFPFALLQLFKLVTNKTYTQFFMSLAAFILLVIADVRFAAMSVFTIIVWQGIEKTIPLKEVINHWKVYALYCLAILGLSAYWLLPAFSLEPTTGAGTLSGLQLISALNPLFLYTPHWPLNEFGKIMPIPWYFIGIPFLIFASLFFKLTRRVLVLTFCFILFAFLAKGETGLFGNLYLWLVNTIPLGGAFRDSTKFFAPLMLFAGILIGLFAQKLQDLFKNRLHAKLVVALVYFYLLFLLHPAILQNMHGVLAMREFPQSLQIISEKVAFDQGFLRTVWFPERHPLSYHTEAKPALDAKSLVNLRPFAALNTGTLDVFNFLQEDESIEWFKLIGAKYLIFPGETRKVDLTNAEQDDWKSLLDLVGQKNLRRVDWETKVPVYEVLDTKPRIFGIEQAVIVVGADDIYKKIRDRDSQFSIGDQGFIFVEDGKTDPQSLLRVAENSTILVFNNKQEEDLILSFLQKYFQSPTQSKKTDWALRGSGDYLKWKYELLVNNIPTHEFDYQQGVAFSTRQSEKITFDLTAQDAGEFILAVRSMSGLEGKPLKGSVEYQNFDITQKAPGQFSWFIKDINLNQGIHELVLDNLGGFQVLNTIALIPKVKWEEALKETKELKNNIQVFNVGQEEEEHLIGVLSNNGWQEIEYMQRDPTEFVVTVPEKIKWIVFTDTYHKDWEIKDPQDNIQFPFYSMVNGFFVPVSGKYNIIFSGQMTVRLGLYISLLSLTVISILAVYYIVSIRHKGK